MRLPRRGTDPTTRRRSDGAKTGARASRQLPWRSRWGSRPAERRRSMPSVGGLRDAPGWQVGGLSCALRGLRPSPVRGPRGQVRGVASVRRTARHRHSIPLALSFEASARCRASRGATRTPKRRTPRPCLSWGSLRCRPSTGHIHRASTPDIEPLFTIRCGGSEEPWGRRHHPSSLSFRPRGFAPPRRFAPREGPRACCIPLPVLGFAALPSACSLRPDIDTARAPTGCGGEAGQLPATLRPFEEFPPLPAVRCHHRLFGPHAVGLHRRGTLQPHPVAGRRW
jgi:hypothetical protein